MEEIKEIEVEEDQSINQIMNLAEENFFQNERIKLISDSKTCSNTSRAADNLVRLGYAIIENIQTLTEILNNERFVKLIIILKRKNNFMEIYEEDTIEIIYKSNDEGYFDFKIFDENFVNNNKNKCKILYNYKIYNLTQYINNINNKYYYFPEDIIKIKLKGIKNITDTSCMFLGCELLISLPDISKWDISKVKNMRCMFAYCDSLISLPDISKWNTSNVKDMDMIFIRCYSLKSLPDISKWNTSNLEKMDYMFDGCKSLISLPDISKWNTSKVNDMANLFSRCSSLISLPDLSKWNTSNVEKMDCMFYHCESLLSLPDISKWNISKVKNLFQIFAGCRLLVSLPDLSKWNTSNVEDMFCMFHGCESLISLPNITKWNTSKIKKMFGMIFECSSLISLPDISNLKKAIFYDREKMNEVFNYSINCLYIPY